MEQKTKKKQAKILLQGLTIALAFSIVTLVVSKPVTHLILSFSDASDAIKYYSEQYFTIRIFSCPAALLNLVFMGWLLGNHQAKKAMWLLVCVNFINIILDLIFVPGLEMGVKGAALASAIADYLGFGLGIYFIYITWINQQFPKMKINFNSIFEDILVFLKFNLDIFIRSLFLQIVFSFMIFKGATFGDDIAAANAIIMNFLFFTSYLMDGFAFSMEAVVGSSLGSKNRQKLQSSLLITTFWSLIISLICTFMFALFGKMIINFMTSITEVRIESNIYFPWLVAFPLISMWSFLLDGIFVGATLGREMRNGMIFASAVYFISYGLMHQYENHALWGCMLIFMTARWFILAWILRYDQQASQKLFELSK
ncbi:MAG: MATE family efflux transporter [Chlamydiota bacterium]|nr:MATE family efflux transporter [Chlamydiota bacterium]